MRMRIWVSPTGRKKETGSGVMERKVPTQTGMKGNQMQKILRKIL